jgi:23S rRNA (cytosine1962-C5)-methyltransferase
MGRWICSSKLPERWTLCHGPVTLELKRTDFGHLGVFPEQADNWEWMTQWLGGTRSPAHAVNGPDAPTISNPSGEKPLKVLNLFAYTGGSTLAAAACGAQVTHVDAAQNVVAWARHNAELSGLAPAPIRWITEDAMKFVRRELKRGSQYDAVILDPPSYGHGPRGEVWRLSKHLGRLLEMCGQLTDQRRQFLLLTCHTPKFGPERLMEIVGSSLPEAHLGKMTAETLKLPTADGRVLPCGDAVRWTRRVASANE